MRLVSLCPSVTDTVFALGRGAALVGRTKFCVQPRAEVERVERVGGTKNPRVDRIVALRPDLVLMNEEENRKEDAEALRAAGLSVLSMLVRDLDGALASVALIGEAIGARTEARQIAGDIARQRDDIILRAATRRRRTFAYLIWQHPWMAVSDDTYVSSLLSAAGGDNVVRGGARYPEIDAGLLASAECVLLSSEPFPFSDKHRHALAAEAGIPLECLQLVDGELLSWHGARTGAGLAYAESLWSAASE